MSAKHRDPEYVANARIVRAQVAAKRRSGREVTCWRCGHEIDPEQRYDVGHIDPDGGHGLGNLAPEHRYKTGRCIGNRADGGRRGAAIQKANRARRAPAVHTSTTSSGLLNWSKNS
ncbi:hypothetical protein [Microbacterium sp. Mcb102]|uniref:hypothetical protein n=1 Tax=Microbacterium sp. Mcb102 TaxID=2926012 RepID=UPI0021C82FEE|nr:hypothetical protein [Microbacterium sp. Mcb102]